MQSVTVWTHTRTRCMWTLDTDVSAMMTTTQLHDIHHVIAVTHSDAAATNLNDVGVFWEAVHITEETRKRAIAKALHLEGHSDFAPVDLAYYQHFLFFVGKYCFLGSSASQIHIQNCLLNFDKGRG